MIGMATQNSIVAYGQVPIEGYQSKDNIKTQIIEEFYLHKSTNTIMQFFFLPMMDGRISTNPNTNDSQSFRSTGSHSFNSEDINPKKHKPEWFYLYTCSKRPRILTYRVNQQRHRISTHINDFNHSHRPMDDSFVLFETVPTK